MSFYGLVDLEDYEALKHYLADLLKPEKEFCTALSYFWLGILF